jgi:ATP-dependent DNA helicase PIF1
MLGSKLRIDGFFSRDDPNRTLNTEECNELGESSRLVLQAALQLRNTLMHGPAGTGKSVTLQRLTDVLDARKIRYALTATTGAAAVNVGGTTVHSFFKGCGLMKGTVEELVRKINYSPVLRATIAQLELFVVEEISMMSAAFLDKIDGIFKAIRKSPEPFGGCAVLFCGDFFQLPPVVDSASTGVYAFEAECWNTLRLYTVEMRTVFRQTDPAFVSLLGRARVGQLNIDDVASLLTRNNMPPQPSDDLEIQHTSLFPTNNGADKVNSRKLSELGDRDPSAVLYSFEAQVSVIPKQSLAEAGVKELFRASQAVSCHAPSPMTLELRTGAQVMLRANLDIRSSLANGSRGVVVGFTPEHGMPRVRFLNGSTRTILPHTFEFKFPEGKVQFVQFPLLLAWAMTIHKSQGCTLDAARISFSGLRTEGQAYVALSRVRTLAGLEIDDFNPRSVRASARVLERFPVTLD